MLQDDLLDRLRELKPLHVGLFIAASFVFSVTAVSLVSGCRRAPAPAANKETSEKDRRLSLIRHIRNELDYIPDPATARAIWARGGSLRRTPGDGSPLVEWEFGSSSFNDPWTRLRVFPLNEAHSRADLVRAARQELNSLSVAYPRAMATAAIDAVSRASDLQPKDRNSQANRNTTAAGYKWELTVMEDLYASQDEPPQYGIILVFTPEAR